MRTEFVFNPFLPEMRHDPYPTYRRLREEDPVHHSPLIRSWVLSRHADVLAFFSDGRLSSDHTKASKYRGGSRASLGTFQTDPPQHTHIRGLVTKALTPRVIDGMRARIEAVTDGLLDALAAYEEVDVIDAFAYRLPMTVISEILGVPARDHDRFQRWGRAFAASVDHTYSEHGQPGVGPEMAVYFAEIIPRRRRQARDDLISALLNVSDGDERLSEGEVVEVLVSLLFAGHETTVNLIGNGLLSLLRNPSELERVRDGELGRTCVEELLRYESPAQIISRAALEDFELHGKEIRKGESVIALLGAANRDSEVFENPDSLDVGRQPNPHVAFGHGAHFCLGAQLSRLEGRVAIPALARRFPQMRLATEHPDWRDTAVLRGLNSLPVRLR